MENKSAFLERLRRWLSVPLAKASEGFTLLEVIIALTIMVLGLGSILAVESGSINASARAKQMNVVAMLARNTMIETEFKMEGKAFGDLPKEEGGAFPAPFGDYRWTRTVKEIEFPAIGGGGANGGEDKGDKGQAGANEAAANVAKQISAFLSKAIREVTVTIFWKKGKAEQKYAVTTYWVDLNHEFSLSP